MAMILSCRLPRNSIGPCSWTVPPFFFVCLGLVGVLFFFRRGEIRLIPSVIKIAWKNATAASSHKFNLFV